MLLFRQRLTAVRSGAHLSTTGGEKASGAQRVVQMRVQRRQNLMERVAKAEETMTRLFWLQARRVAKDKAEEKRRAEEEAWSRRHEERMKNLSWSKDNPLEMMGFYAQYEDTERMGKGRSYPGFMLAALTAANLYLYYVWQRCQTPEELAAVLEQYAARLEGVLVEQRYATLVTNGFLHMTPLSLGGNLFATWLFGWKLYKVLGFARFSLFYLLAIVSSTCAQLLYEIYRRAEPFATADHVALMLRLRSLEFEADNAADANSRLDAVRQAREIMALLDSKTTLIAGGKGASMAVSAGSVLLFPWDRIRVVRWLPFLAMPLPIGVLLFCASELFGVTEQGVVFNLVDTQAEATGFLCGALLTCLLWRTHPTFKSRPIPLINFLTGRTSMRIYRKDDAADLFTTFYRRRS